MLPGTCRCLLCYTVVFTGCIIFQCVSLPSLLIQFHIVRCLFMMSPGVPGGLMAQPMVRGSPGLTLPF